MNQDTLMSVVAVALCLLAPVILVIFGFIGRSIFVAKGYSGMLGFVLGAIGGVIGLIIALILPKATQSVTPSNIGSQPLTPPISSSRTPDAQKSPALTVSSLSPNTPMSAPRNEKAQTVDQLRSEKKSTIVELGQELLPQWREAIALQQDMSQTEATINAYLKVIEKCPTALSAHDNLAGVYMRQNKNEQALAHLEKAIHPSYLNAYVTLGALYYSMRSLDQAIAAFEKAGSEKSAYANLCSAYYAQGNDDAAIEAGEKAVKKYPADPIAYGNLARAYTQAGKQDTARALLESASKILDVNSIRPGISKNWFIHLVILDPETQAVIMIDPRTNEMLFIQENQVSLS